MTAGIKWLRNPPVFTYVVYFDKFVPELGRELQDKIVVVAPSNEKACEYCTTYLRSLPDCKFEILWADCVSTDTDGSIYP